MWEKLDWRGKLLRLSGGSFVAVSILAESEELSKLINSGATYQDCLDFVNSNW
jgi:hypothetical protein